MNRFTLMQIFGVIIVLASFIASIAARLDSNLVQLQDKQPLFLMALLIGLFARSAGEVGALRLKYSDKTETISRKQLTISAIAATTVAGVVIWLGK